MSVNKVILVGNLGRDPDVKYFEDGTKIVTASLATSRKWKSQARNLLKNYTEDTLEDQVE